MVYIHFPSNYTDEERALENKYMKLRRKKKALEKMKEPKPEPEKANPLKRPIDPKDAKELAKKLIQSGKVSLPNKPNVEKTMFKRPRTLERKMLATGRSEGHGGLTPGYSTNFPTSDSIQFQPFTPQSNYDSSSPSAKSNARPELPEDVTKSPPGPKNNSMEGSNKFNDYPQPPNPNIHATKSPSKPKRGPTIYVQAHNLTEEILRNHFEKFGEILNIKLNNPNSTVWFITFSKIESAEYAVHEMHGATVDDISYDVQFARRQPNITQLINDASASASWTALATSHSQKSSFQDKRMPVVYDEPMET